MKENKQAKRSKLKKKNQKLIVGESNNINGFYQRL